MADTTLTGMEDAYSDRLICVCVYACVSPFVHIKVVNMAGVMTDPAEGYSELQSHRCGGGWTIFLIINVSLHTQVLRNYR